MQQQRLQAQEFRNEAAANHRTELVNQIRSMINQNARRRNILSQLGDIERRLYDATQKSRQLSLRRYISSLEQQKYGNYEHKD